MLQPNPQGEEAMAGGVGPIGPIVHTAASVQKENGWKNMCDLDGLAKSVLQTLGQRSACC
jgi:hypothetical protein